VFFGLLSRRRVERCVGPSDSRTSVRLKPREGTGRREEGGEEGYAARTSLVPRLGLTAEALGGGLRVTSPRSPTIRCLLTIYVLLRWSRTKMSLRNSISDLKRRLGRRLTVNRRGPEGGDDAGGEGVDQPGSPRQPEPYAITEGSSGHLQSRNEAEADGKRVDPPGPPPRSGGSGDPVLRSRRGDDEGGREAVIEEKKIRKRDLHRTLGVEDVVEGGPSQTGGQVDQLNPQLRSTTSISHGAESKSTQTACYSCCFS